MDPSDAVSYQSALEDWLDNGTTDALLVGWNVLKAQCGIRTAPDDGQPDGADGNSGYDQQPTGIDRFDAVVTVRAGRADTELQLTA